jgi:hypothetical protein
MLSETDPAILMAAVESLGRMQDKSVVPMLVALIGRSVKELKNNNLRFVTGETLEELTGLQYGPYENLWQKALDDGKL